MPSLASEQPDRTVIPMLAHESLYVGIDIGKKKHLAGFLSTTLLKRHEKFEACPALAFEQSREGFRLLLDRIRAYVPIEQCYVLMERTGNYHKALEEYLLELDIPVFLIHVQERPKGMLKSDKRDALTLANHLYNQLEKGIQVADKTQLVRRAVPATEAATQLKSLVRHRYELIIESTRRKNKLTAICDELFPEFTLVFKDPNGETALAFRGQFPTPSAVMTASRVELSKVKKGRYPSEAQVTRLQQLAAQSIGTKDLNRQRALIFEQSLVLKELKLLQEHLHRLDAEMTSIVEHCREGTILLSIPPMGAIMAATAIAAIGNIANFEKASELKSYFGWAPKREQTGTTFDKVSLSHAGTRTMKQMMYMVVMRAIGMETEWAQIYRRLVPLKCSYNEQTKSYRGKGKVIGRIAGQIICLIYALLKKDQETLSKVAKGATPPEPVLYDAAVHKAHRQGHYQTSKPKKVQEKITLLPKH